MDMNKLLNLLKRQEGPKLDFKECLHLNTESEKKEFAKDIIAIANSRGGRGYIVFGVRDKTKEIIGVNPENFAEEKIQQVVYNRIDPPVPISTDMIEIKSKCVVVLTIYADSHKPHQMVNTGTFYIRRGSTTDVARRGEIANMFQDCGMLSYETVILKNATLSDLDHDLIGQYFSNMGIISETDNTMLLESMGIIGEKFNEHHQKATIGGMLLFGKNPSIFLPHVYVKVELDEGTRFFYGNVLQLLNDVCDYLHSYILTENYPEEALEETIANAIVHRDYLDISRGIHIHISDKKFEITNPGTLMAGNTVYRFLKESNPERRNPWLYQRLMVLDRKGRYSKLGIGMQRVKKAFDGIGHVKYVNLGSSNIFKVILPR